MAAVRCSSGVRRCGRLAELDQHPVATAWVNEDHATTVRPGLRLRGDELVAEALQARYVRVQVVAAETEVMQAAGALLEVACDRTLSVERRHQLDARWGQREEGGARLRRRDILHAVEVQAEIGHEATDGALQVRHRDGDVIEGGNHAVARLVQGEKGSKTSVARPCSAVRSSQIDIRARSSDLADTGPDHGSLAPRPD